MADTSEKLRSLRIDRSAPPRSRAGAWLVAGAVVTAAASAAIWLMTRPRPVEVRTVVARAAVAGSARGTILNGTGYVTARRAATVSSKVTGKVEEVLIEEGMEVTLGQVLARLDPANAQVSLDLARAQLQAARSAVAESVVRRIQADLDLTRVEGLVRGAVASPAQLDAARAERDALVARVALLREQVRVAERELALWQQQLDDTVIRAPFAGVVVAKNAQPGEMISPAAAGGFTRTGIGTIVDMSSLEIEVDVNESYINRVAAGQAVEAVLDAYPDWKIPAHVIAIIPTADRQKATVEVRIGFDALDPRILPDMGVKVGFQEEAGATTAAGVAGGGSSAVAVPSAAVRRSGDIDRVFVVEGGRAVAHEIRVLRVNGGDTSVSRGIAAGARVVVEGPADLTDGQAVEEMR